MKPRNGDVVIIDKNATTKWQNSRCVVTVVNKATETALVKILKDSKGNYVYHEEIEIWVTFTALKVIFTSINLMELINMSLDMRDEEWFLEITEFKKHYDKVMNGGALSGKE